MCKKVKEDLFVSQEERVKIELNTRLQSGCSLWYEVRVKMELNTRLQSGCSLWYEVRYKRIHGYSLVVHCGMKKGTRESQVQKLVKY